MKNTLDLLTYADAFALIYWKFRHTFSWYYKMKRNVHIDRNNNYSEWFLMKIWCSTIRQEIAYNDHILCNFRIEIIVQRVRSELRWIAHELLWCNCGLLRAVCFPFKIDSLSSCITLFVSFCRYIIEYWVLHIYTVLKPEWANSS